MGVTTIRTVDHDIPPGMAMDMRDYGRKTDDFPTIYRDVVVPADIIVLATPIWLGDQSSQTRLIIERLYAYSGETNAASQWAYYGKVGGALVTGNEDGGKHCSAQMLYTMQHIGLTVPPQADSYWNGEAGPGPSYLDNDTQGAHNNWTTRNTVFMTGTCCIWRACSRTPARSPTATARRTGIWATRTTRIPSTAPESLAARPPGNATGRPLWGRMGPMSMSGDPYSAGDPYAPRPLPPGADPVAANADSVTPIAPPASAIPTTKAVLTAGWVTGLTAGIICLILRVVAAIFGTDFMVVRPGSDEPTPVPWLAVFLVPIVCGVVGSLVAAIFLGVRGCQRWVFWLGTLAVLISLASPLLQPETVTWPTRSG